MKIKEIYENIIAFLIENFTAICEKFEKASKMTEEVKRISEDIKKDIDAYWVSSLNRLADVLYKKNAVSGLSVKMRSCTSRGFSAIIQEGSTREFDARMIWAAEDSTIVTPHFRYIVTERKL